MLRLIPRAEARPDWQKPDELPDAIWRILYSRGCATLDEARAFLNPSLNDIIGPYALFGMAEAVNIINKHIENGKKICIWGDYDVDGVCATAIMLNALKFLGANVEGHIPKRNEGYGFNEEGVLSLDCDLLISVDCGVSEKEIIKKAHVRRMSVIVTDHHALPSQLPDCPIVNPRLGDYPNPGLCGAGVAFKLAMALTGNTDDYIDLAALATVADIVPLTGENRAIVSLGLKKINRTRRTGIEKLIKAAGLTGDINSQNIAFGLAPRLNAAGRLEDAGKALQLLTTKDEAQAYRLATELDALNSKRRESERKVADECEIMLKNYGIHRAHCITLKGEGWNPGVVGLAASRLVKEYSMPVVLLSETDGVLTGSCRSIPGCDIHKCLTMVSGFLTRFGGHSQAAGLTMPKANFADFKRALDDVIAQNTPEDAFIPSVEYDCCVSLSELTPEFIKKLDLLEPTGFGNPQALFMSAFDVSDVRRMGKDGRHASFSCIDNGAQIRGVWFGRADTAVKLEQRSVQAVYSPAINDFRGVIQPQILIQDALIAPEQALSISKSDEEARVNLFITHRLYNTPYIVENPAISVARLKEMLETPRGTCIVTADAQSARALIGEIGGGGLDAYIGEYPTDPRAFNAICVLPVGDIPKEYTNVVCVRMPAWLLGGDYVGVSGLGRADWLSEMPDKAKLRAIYIACKGVCGISSGNPSVAYLLRVIAQNANVTPACAGAGLMALRSMELVDFDPESAKLALCRMVKTDPNENAIFLAATELIKWGGA